MAPPMNARHVSAYSETSLAQTSERPHRSVPEQKRELEEQDGAEHRVEGVLQPRREALVGSAMGALV
jgi:hypothetical protein